MIREKKNCLNFNLEFTVANVAQILGVEKNQVKEWANEFSEYMSSNANPKKGTPREFNIDDIRVMAYIFSFWEDNPDIECIKMGLNSNNHYEHEMIDNLLIEATPIFIKPPEGIDETWKHGVLFSGLAQFGDQFYLANSYKLAGDR